jgi:hypothetical protein
MQANLAPEWWGEAVTAATATTNCLPSLSKSKASPIELMFKSKPNLDIFRSFGCRAWIIKPSQNRTRKFGSLSWEGIHLGYENDLSTYKLLRLEDKKIVTTKHVHFDESTFPVCPALNRSCNAYGINKLPAFSAEEPLPYSEEQDLDRKRQEVEDEELDGQEQGEMVNILGRMVSAEEPSEGDMNDAGSSSHEDQPMESSPQAQVGPRRLILRPPQHPTRVVGDISTSNIRNYKRRTALVATVSTQDPLNHKQAMSGPDSTDWKDAELKEVDNMLRHDVWLQRRRVSDDSPIPSTWAFRKKLGDKNQVIEYKARICAQGFRQTYGLNFLAKYAPTGRPASLRMLISFAVDNGLAIHQLDVRSAFLTCPLEDKVTLLPPPGFDCPPDTVLELKKAIYGLKQAPLVWYKRLSAYLQKLGFSILKSDPCVFWRVGVAHREDTWIFAHVDDLVIISKRPELFKSEMEAEFSIKYPGEAVFLLGMNIECSDHGISINQTQYIERKLAQFGLDMLHPATCPLNPKEYLRKATSDEVSELHHLGVNYRALVGSLNYLSVLTRPDIAYAVSTLSQYLDRPGIKHYHAAVQVFRYLSGTRHLGLNFFKNQLSPLVAYVDADWGNCPDTRRSTTGFVVMSGRHMITWKSSKQSTISLSTSEAEYKALSDLGRELAWLDSFVNETDLSGDQAPIMVKVDNRGAIDLAKSKISQNGFRTKHMDIRLHFVRELLEIGLMTLIYVPSNGNAADFLTKPVGRCPLRRSLTLVGMLQASQAALTLATQSTGGCQTIGFSASSKKRRMTARADSEIGKP